MKHYILEDGTRVTVLNHSLSKRTILQSVIFAIVLAPICFLFATEKTIGTFVWNVIACALAPVIVDALKPTWIFHRRLD